MGSQLRVGRSRQQERETAGRVAPLVVTKQEMNARARLSFFQRGTPAHGKVCSPPVGWVFSLQLSQFVSFRIDTPTGFSLRLSW